jgi:hypothetical protein
MTVAEFFDKLSILQRACIDLDFDVVCEAHFHKFDTDAFEKDRVNELSEFMEWCQNKGLQYCSEKDGFFDGYSYSETNSKCYQLYDTVSIEVTITPMV